MRESSEKIIILSTISILVMTLSTIAYTLSWAILFSLYKEKKSYNSDCFPLQIGEEFYIFDF